MYIKFKIITADMSSKSRNGKDDHHNSKLELIGIIDVNDGIKTILNAMKTCYESKVRTVIILDETYTPNSLIYKNEEVEIILKKMAKNKTVVYFTPTLDIEEFEIHYPNRKRDEILMYVPSDLYVTKLVVKKTLEYIKLNYEKYDHFSIAPETNLESSVFTGLVFSLFVFDWIRNLVSRFKIHENTHLRFTVLKRTLGHPIVPSTGWLNKGRVHPYIYGGSGACLHPSKVGLEYFLYLLNSHSRFGIGSFLFFQLVWSLLIGIPIYNWMPLVNHWVSIDVNSMNLRIVVWLLHGMMAVTVTNKYFNQKGSLQWIHAMLIPFWISFPMFFLLMFYGRYLYTGHRTPPTPPSFFEREVVSPQQDSGKGADSNSSDSEIEVRKSK